jgi:hypothetical protein
MQPGPCHRHGFAALINGARCIATMQPASPVSIARIPPVDWGCQWTGKYAIKGRLIHAIQPWFVSKDACAEYSGLFKYWGPFDRWDHGFAGDCAYRQFLCL